LRAINKKKKRVGEGAEASTTKHLLLIIMVKLIMMVKVITLPDNAGEGVGEGAEALLDLLPVNPKP